MGEYLYGHLLLCCHVETEIAQLARVAVALLFFLCLTCLHANSLTAAEHCYRGSFPVSELYSHTS